jgi:hypothetical protein
MTARPAPGAEPVTPDVVRTLGSVVLALIARQGLRAARGSVAGLLMQLGIPHDDAVLLADWLQASVPTRREPPS